MTFSKLKESGSSSYEKQGTERNNEFFRGRLGATGPLGLVVSPFRPTLG